MIKETIAREPEKYKYFYFLGDEDIQEDEDFCRLTVHTWNEHRLGIPVDAIDCMMCDFRGTCDHPKKTKL